DLGDASRKIAIAIYNRSPYTFEYPTKYFSSGNDTQAPPYVVKSNEGIVWGASGGICGTGG
ncbi:12141_t:CDS:1, partial [Racocetra persica]